MNYEQFDNGYNYLTANGYIEMRNKCRNFFYGNQWEAVSEETKNIPRTVFNICKQQVVNKQANITSVPVSLKFYTNNSEQDTIFVTGFVKYLLKEMKHDKHRNSAVWDSLVKGTAVQHMYYNPNKLGTYGDFVGGICEEIIDFQNVVVANPFNNDEQSQKYIIIRHLESYGAIKEMLKGDAEKIKRLAPDNVSEVSDKVEMKDSDLIYTYLKYYRIDGEVYHSLSTKTVEIYKNRPLNPNLVKVKKIKGKNEDEQWLSLPDDDLETNTPEEYGGIKFTRYPVHFLSLNDMDDSIYGVSELHDVIATQKFINQLWSMQLLNVINMAWDKYVVMPGALRNQVIDDTSGQVLVDYTNTGNGIKRLGGMNAMSNGVVQLSADAFNLHRSIHQITDLFTGQTDNKDIAASALAQLNNQADKPIDLMRQRLWDFEEEIGKTLELFIKLYYTKQKFSYELANSELIAKGSKNMRFADAEFDSSKYQDVQFHVVVEAVQGTKNSELVQENLIQSLFLNGTWNNMTTHDREFYIEMSPLAAPFKDDMKALLEKQKQDEISMLQQQLQQVQGQSQALYNALLKAQKGINYMKDVNNSMAKSYKDEVKAHQDDVKVRDEAVNEILTKDPTGDNKK